MSASFVILLVATGIAIASAVFSWRVVRRDREREAARVAALSDAIDNDPAVVQENVAHSVQVVSLFAPRERDGGRALRLGIGVAAAVVVIAAVFLVSRPHSSEVAATAGRPAAATDAHAAPLELVSMNHAREGNTFVVSGFVRNPRTGTPAIDLMAVVFAFDKAGSFIASGRAPIDFTTLEPGDGSPFVVNIATTASVARYRVAFRQGNTVVRHLDRRTAPVSLASNRR